VSKPAWGRGKVHYSGSLEFWHAYTISRLGLLSLPWINDDVNDGDYHEAVPCGYFEREGQLTNRSGNHLLLPGVPGCVREIRHSLAVTPDRVRWFGAIATGWERANTSGIMHQASGLCIAASKT
jgi:hypothetical protein